MAKDCTYSWNGVEWILDVDNSGGGNCVCPASHWGPEPDDPRPGHVMTTPALCKGPPGTSPEELAEFASIGRGESNHEAKSKKFEKLSKQWDKAIEDGMKQKGIKVSPKKVGE